MVTQLLPVGCGPEKGPGLWLPGCWSRLTCLCVRGPNPLATWSRLRLDRPKRNGGKRRKRPRRWHRAQGQNSRIQGIRARREGYGAWPCAAKNAAITRPRNAGNKGPSCRERLRGGRTIGPLITAGCWPDRSCRLRLCPRLHAAAMAVHHRAARNQVEGGLMAVCSRSRKLWAGFGIEGKDQPPGAHRPKRGDKDRELAG